MKEIVIDENGGPVMLRFRFESVALAVYSFTLWEAQSNVSVIYKKGNNKNPDDDIVYLPSPLKQNENRILDLSCDLKVLDPLTLNQYRVVLEILQNGEKIGEITDPEDDEQGTLNDKVLKVMIFGIIKLK